MRFKRRIVLISLLVLLALGTRDASALSIVRDLLSSGSVIPGTSDTAGAAPVTTAGGGDFVSIVNVAASLWEAAILDSHTVTIHFAWVRSTP